MTGIPTTFTVRKLTTVTVVVGVSKIKIFQQGITLLSFSFTFCPPFPFDEMEKLPQQYCYVVKTKNG